MRRFLTAILFCCASVQAATTINVGSTPLVTGVKRFGISGISHYYYDRLLLKNLVWHNAGFEGLLFQVVERCDSGLSATGCIDSNQYTAWPNDFWNGGTYEFILGTAKGRTGTIASFAKPVAPAGSTWTFADAGTAPAQGDYFLARKYFPGGADVGWNPNPTGGAAITTETADLPPNTDGRQCIGLSAGPGQTATISSFFGWFGNQIWVVMNGTYHLSFKAKGIGGANTLGVRVLRDPTTFLNQNVTLSSSWATYDIDFSAAESGTLTGPVALVFSLANSSALIDDVSIVQTNGDPTNTTAFRDPVIAALRSFNPGSLRAHVLDLGQGIDDLIAPPFGRVRSEFHASATDHGPNQYGWQEFLELCQAVGAEPYLILPIATSDTEMRNAIEYLAGPSTSPYGARRAARGHPAPWTDAFARIHIEYGNESWNSVYLGATMYAADYGRRGNDLFAAARQSPYYSPKFNLILGVQAANPFNTRVTHNASANHDMLAIGPYIATWIDDFATNEQLFGSLFAEASWWSIASNGPVKQTYDFINATSRPVPMIVYEVNLHTTMGSISQAALDSFTPSVGAGLAVANHMLHMLQEEKVRDQLIFSLAGYRYDRIQDGKTVLIWGITRDMGVTDRKRPQYLAAKLVNEALSGDLVQTTQSGDNPTWNEPLTNRIQMDNVPFIQTFSFVNGTRRAIVVFNLHRTDALQVTFTGANAPRGAVTMKRLTSANLTDNNEDAENVVVTTQQLASFDPSQPLSLPPFSMTLLTGDAAATPARLRGDVNGNGSVSAFDAALVLQAVVGATTLDAQSQCAADYNANGSMSAFDASLILQCVVGGTCSTGTCN